jgi:hypothetical protein
VIGGGRESATADFAGETPSTGCPPPAIMAKMRPQIIKRDSALLKEAMNSIKAQSECILNPPAEDCVISSVGSWPQAASLEFYDHQHNLNISLLADILPFRFEMPDLRCQGLCCTRSPPL